MVLGHSCPVKGREEEIKGKEEEIKGREEGSISCHYLPVATSVKSFPS